MYTVEVSTTSGIPTFIFEDFIFEAAPGDLLVRGNLSSEPVCARDYAFGTVLVIPQHRVEELRTTLAAQARSF